MPTPLVTDLQGIRTAGLNAELLSKEHHPELTAVVPDFVEAREADKIIDDERQAAAYALAEEKEAEVVAAKEAGDERQAAAYALAEENEAEVVAAKEAQKLAIKEGEEAEAAAALAAEEVAAENETARLSDLEGVDVDILAKGPEPEPTPEETPAPTMEPTPVPTAEPV